MTTPTMIMLANLCFEINSRNFETIDFQPYIVNLEHVGKWRFFQCDRFHETTRTQLGPILSLPIYPPYKVYLTILFLVLCRMTECSFQVLALLLFGLEFSLGSFS